MKLYQIADISDIEEVLALQKKYQVDTINEEDKKDGFVTTPFTNDQLKRLVLNENGLFVAKDKSKVIAYAMAASWSYWKEWAMFKFMIEELPKLSFLNQNLTTENSYQYGPVCIDKKVRGTGLLESLFDFTREQMSKRYPIMITFINKNNPRSYEAHTRKLGMTTIHEFKFNNNEYYELAYDSYKEIQI